MAGSIQFRGVDQVMQAFENRDVDAWSVWQHRQFMFKGIGAGDLKTLLDNLAVGATNCIYTIKVYEDLTDVKKIKEKTECDGSFNFRLDDSRQEITGAQYYAVGHNKQIMDRLDAIEEKFNNNLPEDDEPETIGSVVIDVIKDPDKAMKWAEIIKSFFSGQTMQPVAPVRQLPISQSQPAAMGNVEQPVTAKEFTEDQLTRLDKVTDILFAKDPNLIEHLEKLADMAEKSPRKFKSLLTMLEIF